MANPIVIQKGLRLGELDAEADTDLLGACFVDNGQLSDLLNLNSPQSVVLGRTGSGKSAMLFQIQAQSEKSALLDPNDISISFLEHSNIIQFFNELGVRLDLFYRILWRHILVVELLKLRYELRNENESRSFLQRITEWVQLDPVRKRAFEYFSEWGDRFWLETDEQLVELTNKFTEDLKAGLETEFSGVDISLQGAKNLSEESRVEVKSLATQVVSGIQIKKLNEVLELIRDYAFNDSQKRFYILIDKLDENWAESETRYRFIRSLVEETKSLRNIPQVKIVTALRVDLLNTVFDKTREAGFQEEKYEAYLSTIRWSKQDLRNVLNNRVKEVFRRKYSGKNVDMIEIFPKQKKGHDGDALDFILDRTLMRPRDVIQFANECFALAADTNRLTWRNMSAAEASYSSKRLNSLFEEWDEYYPSLPIVIELVRSLNSEFTRSSVVSSKLQDSIGELSNLNVDDSLIRIAKSMYDPNAKTTEADFLSEVLRCLYHVGAIGIKIKKNDTYRWSHLDQPRVTKSEVKRTTNIKVHKMLRHALESSTQ